MNISVIGTGYLGAVHAAGMAALGHDVIGVDADVAKIASLARGESPFFEPGFPELLVEMRDAGRLRFTTDLAEVADADVHFVCVGTPQKNGSGHADTSQVEAVVHELGGLLRPGALIVGKSTVPVGTARRMREEWFAATGEALPLAWNPEFLREGFAVEDTLTPDRLVFGVVDERSEQVLRELYAPILETGTPVVVSDLASAELVKVTANSFLATKISFINAVAEVCEAVGADVATIADALGLDDRIGRRFLNAGVGFGGGCLGKDIRAFGARSDQLGVASVGELLGTVDAINERRRARVIELVDDLTSGVRGRRVTVLGAAFKPNTDDVRESPALDVARRLHALGADVRIHDPEALDNVRRVAPELRAEGDLLAALCDSEVLVVLTEWDEYRELDPFVAGAVVASRVVVDGRNCLDAEAWAAAGWECRTLGRPGHVARRPGVHAAG